MRLHILYEGEEVKRIGYDMDDVIIDTDTQLREKIFQLFRVDISREDRQSYYFGDIPDLLSKLGVSKNELENMVLAAFKDLAKDGMMPGPITGAVKAIKELQKMGHKVYIITARSRDDLIIKHLAKLGIVPERIYFCGSGTVKGASHSTNKKANLARALKLDYFIDDSAENLSQFLNTGEKKSKPTVYDTPWNRSNSIISPHASPEAQSKIKGWVPSLRRIKSHDDILDLI